MSCTVLSQYPFSQGFRLRLESNLGDTPSYVSLSELRDLPAAQIWKRLRSIRSERLVIPMEDEDARAVLPFLKLLAGITSARRIDVVGSDLSQSPASRWSLFADVLSISQASVRGRIAAAASRYSFESLLRVPRTSAVLAECKRVLYINANLWFGVKAGGSVGHVAGVANGLTKVGFEVDYASPADNAMISPVVNRIILTRPTSFAVPPENTQYLYDKAATHQLDSVIEDRYAFIYQRMSIANVTGVKLSRKHKLPYVLEYNGSEAWAAKNWGRPLKNHGLAVQAEDVCLRHAHVVVTISDVLREELQARGVEAERIACYPNCIDEELFTPDRFTKNEIAELRSRYGIAPDAVTVGFIGTFGPWHGADVLAHAIRKMILEDKEWVRRSGIHFLLMGDGAKMPLVKQALGEDKSPFWTLTGLIPQSHAALHLAATNILVAPHVSNVDGTRFFGSPTKLFEYMAMEKAIVASDLDQIGQVLKASLRTSDLPSADPSGPTDYLAVLCQPGNVDDLVLALRFLVNRPGWRVELGRNARKEALAKYTWKNHVNRILETLHEVGLSTAQI
jgi:glycosyltransferase involved in cell wall biosynthesis